MPPNTSKGVGSSAAQRLQDIVIHTNGGIFGKEDLLQSLPPVRERIQIADDVWIGRLSSTDAKTLMDLCDLRGIDGQIPTRQFAQLYAFVREQNAGARLLHEWDHDSKLQTGIALSRIVHPTTIGYSYAVRVLRNGDAIQNAFPAKLQGVGIQAWISPNHKRDWLTRSEVTELKSLWSMLTLRPLPARLRRAMWYYEYAARTYYADLRWVLICTALESMVHTDRYGSTKQFVTRVTGLANDLGIAFTEEMGTTAYDLRSRLAHGLHFLSEVSHEFLIYDTMEEIVRAVILKSIGDEKFAELFTSDNRIRDRWPLV